MGALTRTKYEQIHKINPRVKIHHFVTFSYSDLSLAVFFFHIKTSMPQ